MQTANLVATLPLVGAASAALAAMPKLAEPSTRTVDRARVIDAFGACDRLAAKTREAAAKEHLCSYTMVRRKP